MTAVLLSCAIVIAWGSWIPLAQLIPGAPQSTRTLYVTAGNLLFAAVALVIGGSAGQLTLGWKEFWMPLAGGVVWAVGSGCAFRATETIGLARAAGTWTPLNIIVAFVFGALLFHELRGFDAARFTVLGGCLVLVLAGVFLIVGSQNAATEQGTATADPPEPQAALAVAPGPISVSGTALPVAAPAAVPATRPSTQRRGLLSAVGAGLLWGGYFVPAQWAAVPSQLGNFPLAVGMLLGAAVLALRDGGLVRLAPRQAALQLTSGVLLGIGMVTLLLLVNRIGTGAGFTIGQLSLLVNAGIGIWVFKVPAPGTRAARTAFAGILLAGIGGTVIGALR